MIAEATGGELFSIRTTDPYPETYDATIELAQEENTEAARPTLATHIENLDAYDYDLPRIPELVERYADGAVQLSGGI